MEAEIGRISVENVSLIAPEGQPKERICSLRHMELELLAGASLSYRKGLALLNRPLRREPESEVKFRTYLDFCQKVGKKAEESAAREAEARLRGHGFDPESGKPRSLENLPAELREGAKAEENGETIAKTIKKINAWRPLEDEQAKASQTEAEKPEETTYISADDVGVRHQKERRVAEHQKDGAFVWSMDALVQSREGEGIFTCAGMKKTFLMALAHLLDKRFLEWRPLVFFIGGASNLLTNIAEMFAFHPYRVILDWHRLKKTLSGIFEHVFQEQGGEEADASKTAPNFMGGKRNGSDSVFAESES